MIAFYKEPSPEPKPSTISDLIGSGKYYEPPFKLEDDMLIDKNGDILTVFDRIYENSRSWDPEKKEFVYEKIYDDIETLFINHIIDLLNEKWDDKKL